MTCYYGIVHKNFNQVLYAVLASSSGNDALKTAVDSGISPESIIDIRYLDRPDWDDFGQSTSADIGAMNISLLNGNGLTVTYMGLPYSMKAVDSVSNTELQVEFFDKTNNIPISCINLRGVDPASIYAVLDEVVLLYHVELLDTLEQLQYGNVTLH